MNEDKAINTEQALAQEAKESPLSDILIAGFVDDCDNIKTFHPIMDHVYIKIGSTLFMLLSAHQHSSLAIRQIMKIKCEFDIDEDDEFCVCSVAQMFLSAPYADSDIQHIEWFQVPPAEGGAPLLKAMGMLLDREEYIFFDPLNYFGIQIGGRDRRNIWLAENPNTNIATSAIKY